VSVVGVTVIVSVEGVVGLLRAADIQIRFEEAVKVNETPGGVVIRYWAGSGTLPPIWYENGTENSAWLNPTRGKNMNNRNNAINAIARTKRDRCTIAILPQILAISLIFG